LGYRDNKIADSGNPSVEFEKGFHPLTRADILIETAMQDKAVGSDQTSSTFAVCPPEQAREKDRE